MPEEINPSKVQQTVKRGFERMKSYKRARAMFVKEFVGQYYAGNKIGLTGDQPINLIFHTIRALVPNLVMENPINELVTNYTPQRFYGELLGLAIDQVQRETNFKETLRAWIVDAIFAWGIMKTGIAATGEMIQFGDIQIDPGQIYNKLIDLDDFVIDPVCTTVNEATYLGSRIRVPRQLLLDTKGYDHDLVKQLGGAKFNSNDKVEDISKQQTATMEMFTLQDFVDVVELWIPGANSLVTIPDPMQTTFDKYLRVTDYYGPEEGPYTFLSFTPPVPNNPFPVAPVSMWYDLHRMANRVFKRVMNQSDRQKDILLYNPMQADEAQDIIDAEDGDVIASSDPKGAQTYSFGGQNRSNELMLQQLQVWYNYIAGNPDQMMGNLTPGTKGSRTTATQSQILQGNASITIEDARGILYDQTAKVSQKIAWYLHTDPLINLPVTKRASGGQQIQLWLTPEQRKGDFLKFIFKITARSMSRLDPTIKSQRIIQFATNLIPALMSSAQISMQMGMQFNVQKAITDLAKELELTEYVQDWFNDPEFEQKMMIMMSMGPQNAGKANQITPGAIRQNEGFPGTRNIPGPTEQFNQNAQMGANENQSANFGVR